MSGRAILMKFGNISPGARFEGAEQVRLTM